MSNNTRRSSSKINRQVRPVDRDRRDQIIFNVVRREMSPHSNAVRITQLGHNQAWTTCPYCRQVVLTEVSRTPRCIATVTGILLCLFCLPSCCCCLGLIPCLMPSCIETVHTCPSCRQIIVQYVGS